jgi:hypothetical protein
VELTPIEREHLRLLSIAHYVMAGLTALWSCLGLLYAGMGAFMALGQFQTQSNPPPAFMGWLFVGIGLTVLVLGWGFAFCLFLCGRYIARRKSWLFCLIIAGLHCPAMPFGTVLGVCTFIVLLKPAVKEEFQRPALCLTPA